MKSFVITLFDLEHSEQGAERCIESGKEFDLTIEKFEAVNKYEAESKMYKLGLFLNSSIYQEITDEAIGDRGRAPKGDWKLSHAELGCFLSHYLLWEKAVEINENIIILEHDVKVISAVPKVPDDLIAINLCSLNHVNTCAYIITPQAAALAVEEAKSNGIQPSDELLWTCALKGRTILKPKQEIIQVIENGISTIQWTRTDHHHRHILSEDPWKKFKGIKKSLTKNEELETKIIKNIMLKPKDSPDSLTVRPLKTITLPIHNRPQYLQQTLDSLSKQDTTGYKLFINIEPNNKACVDLVKQIDFIDFDCQINTEKLGVKLNPYNLIERTFKAGSEWNYHIEDDLIFATDAISLVNWYFNNQQENIIIYGTNNRRKITNNTLNNHIYSNPAYFSGLGWCVNQSNWNTLLSKVWCNESPFGKNIEDGWDWNLSRLLRHSVYREMIPVVCRSTTIGEFGTYSSSKSFEPFKELKLSTCSTNTKYHLID